MENNITPEPVIDKPSNLTFDTTGLERLLTIALRRIEDLELKVNKISNQKIIDETKLSPDVLSENGLLDTAPKKTKRGQGYRPILKGEIEEALDKTVNAASAARYLAVSRDTFVKYARMYGVYRTNQHVKDKKYLHDVNSGKYPIREILENKHPNLGDFIVKDKLIRGNILPAKCNICGFDKRRIIDNKLCLLLDHKDGDKKNFSLDNLQLLCLNCTFECGRGYIRSGTRKFDVDWLQGAPVQS